MNPVLNVRGEHDGIASLVIKGVWSQPKVEKLLEGVLKLEERLDKITSTPLARQPGMILICMRSREQFQGSKFSTMPASHAAPAVSFLRDKTVKCECDIHYPHV